MNVKIIKETEKAFYFETDYYRINIVRVLGELSFRFIPKKMNHPILHMTKELSLMLDFSYCLPIKIKEADDFITLIKHIQELEDYIKKLPLISEVT